MSNVSQTFRIDSTKLNQELTQQAVLDKLCDLLGQSGNSWYESGSIVAAPTFDTSVFLSTAVPALKKRYIGKVEITCSRAGAFTILKGATEIGAGHLSADVHNHAFVWLPPYELLTAETVEVVFNQDRGTAALVKVFIHGIEK